MKQKVLKRNSLITLSLWLGVVAPLLCTAIFTLDGATRPGYDQFHHWVSHLSLGSRGWLGTANLAFIGAALSFLALGLYKVITKGRGATWAPRLVLLAGLGFIIASIFKQDPGLGYPAGTAAVTGSVADSIHGAAALLMFASLTALCFVMAKRFDKSWRTYSLVSAYTIIITFVACSVLVSLDYAKVWVGAPSGLLERVALVAALLYVTMLSHRLLRKN